MSLKRTATTDLFLELTPQKVLEAVDAAGLETAPVCQALNSFENRVYDVVIYDGEGEEGHVVAKFYRPGRWTEAQILEEHRFMNALDEAEVPLCRLRPFPDGDTLKQIEGIYYCLYPRFGGRAPDELNDELVERLGMLTARMHNVGAAGSSEHRVRLNADTYVRDDLEWMLDNDVLPETLSERYAAAAYDLADIYERVSDGVAVQRIHGDLHAGNLLLRDGRLHLLDFDDHVVGPVVQDLWLLLPGRDAWTRAHRELFLDAYQQLRPFDRTSLRLIEPLRGLRMVHYAAWLARRWHDPVFPQTWPHAGTPAYWEQETRDLEELLAIIRRDESLPEDLRGAAGEEEPELSNKDFFWDWPGDEEAKSKDGGDEEAKSKDGGDEEAKSKDGGDEEAKSKDGGDDG